MGWHVLAHATGGKIVMRFCFNYLTALRFSTWSLGNAIHDARLGDVLCFLTFRRVTPVSNVSDRY